MNSRQRRKLRRYRDRCSVALIEGLKKFNVILSDPHEPMNKLVGDVIRAIHADTFIPKMTVTNTPYGNIGEAKFMEFFKVKPRNQLKYYVDSEGAEMLMKEGVKRDEIVITDEIKPL